MKKRTMSILLGTTVIVSSLSGCGLAGQTAQQQSENQKAKENSDGKVELEFFNCKVEGEAVFNKVIEKFQEENPNIIIKQTAPTDAETVLFTRISTGDVPDIMTVYPAETAYHTMMDDGVYIDLSNEEWLSRASDKALEFSAWNGKTTRAFCDEFFWYLL